MFINWYNAYLPGFNAYLTHQLDPALKEDDNSHMDVVKGFKPERWLSEDTKPTEYSTSLCSDTLSFLCT